MRDVKEMTTDELGDFIYPHVKTLFIREVESELMERSLTGDRLALMFLKDKWTQQMPQTLRLNNLYRGVKTAEFPDLLRTITVAEKIQASEAILEIKQRMFEGDDEAYEIHKWYQSKLR